MDKEIFCIQKELRIASDGKKLSEAIDVFLSNEESMLCVDPCKRTITLEECKNAPKGTYYFFQEYSLQNGLSRHWHGIDTTKPFLVVVAEATPYDCPLQPRKHVLYLCQSSSN